MTLNEQIYTKRDDCCANETITNLLAPYHGPVRHQLVALLAGAEQGLGIEHRFFCC